MLYKILLHLLSFAGLLCGAAAFLYGLYCLVQMMRARMRLAARPDALWLVPLSILGLDWFLQSDDRRALKLEAFGWMWRSMMAIVVSGVGLVVWAGANPAAPLACTGAADGKPTGGCSQRTKMDPVARIKKLPTAAYRSMHWSRP